MKKVIASSLAVILLGSPVFAAGGAGGSPVFLDVGAMMGRGPVQARAWQEPLVGLSRLLSDQRLNLAQRLDQSLVHQPFYPYLSEFGSHSPQAQARAIYDMAPMLAELPPAYLHDLGEQVAQATQEPRAQEAEQESAPQEPAQADPIQAVAAILANFQKAYEDSLPKVKDRLAAVGKLAPTLQDGDYGEIVRLFQEVRSRARLYGSALAAEFATLSQPLQEAHVRITQAWMLKNAARLADDQGAPGAAPQGEVAAGQTQVAAPAASEVLAVLQDSLLGLGELLYGASRKSTAQTAGVTKDVQTLLQHWVEAYGIFARMVVAQSPEAPQRLKDELEQATDAMNKAFRALLKAPGKAKIAKRFQPAVDGYFSALAAVLPAADLNTAEAQDTLFRVAMVAAGVQADVQALRQRAEPLGLAKLPKGFLKGLWSWGRAPKAVVRLEPPSREHIEERDLDRVRAAIRVLYETTDYLTRIRFALEERIQAAPKPEVVNEETTYLPPEQDKVYRGIKRGLEIIHGFDQSLLDIILFGAGYIPLNEQQELQSSFSRFASAEYPGAAHAARDDLRQLEERLAGRMGPLVQNQREALVGLLMQMTAFQGGMNDLYADAAKEGLLVLETAPSGLTLSAEPGTPVTDVDWAQLKAVFRSLTLARWHLVDIGPVVYQIGQRAQRTGGMVSVDEAMIAQLAAQISELVRNVTSRLNWEVFVLGTPVAARKGLLNALSDFKRQLAEVTDLGALLTAFETAFEALRPFLPATLNQEQRQVLPAVAQDLDRARGALGDIYTGLTVSALWMMDSPSVQRPARDMSAFLQMLFGGHASAQEEPPADPEPST